MKLQRITLNYPKYLEQFQLRNSEFFGLTYQGQYERLMEDGFGWANFLSQDLRSLGWTVWEPVTNFEPHQKVWAGENAVSYSEGNWLLEITAAQIKHFAPEVLFVDSYTAFHPEFLQRVREQTPSLKLIFGWCGAPCLDYGVFRGFDLTLSNIPSLVDELRNLGLQAELLPHSFPTVVLDQIKLPAQRPEPFTFTGSVFPGSEFHAERLELLIDLQMKTPMKVYADVALPPNLEQVLAAAPDAGWWEKRKLRKSHQAHLHFAKRARASVFGREMYQLLANSQITFNNHIGMSRDHATNTRLFQATGCGACLLTDWKPDLHHYFEPEKEVVTYRTAQEAIANANYLLRHPKECQAIAEAGRQRTMRDHTFAQRCVKLDAIMRAFLG